jgi:hypothetical protein
MVLHIRSQVFLVALYVAQFNAAAWVTQVVYWSFPVFAFKQAMNVVQLYDACQDIISMDIDEFAKQKTK